MATVVSSFPGKSCSVAVQVWAAGARRFERHKLLACALWLLGLGIAEADQRPWQTTDSVAVRYYGPSFVDWLGNAHQPVATPSPGGKYFYIQSTRGDLSCSCMVQTLEVYESARIQNWLTARTGRGIAAPLAPTARVEMRSKKAGAALAFEQWNEAGTAIEFLGRDSNQAMQVYRLQVPSAKLEKLTTDPADKPMLLVRRHLALYQRQVPVEPTPQPNHAAILPVPRNASGDISMPSDPRPSREFVAVYQGGEQWVLPIEGNPGNIWLSSEGQRAVFWVSATTEKSQYKLVDFARQQTLSIGGAILEVRGQRRTTVAPQVLWSADSNQAIVVNVKPFTLGSSSPSTLDASFSVAVYDVPSGQWQVLEAVTESGHEVQSVGWLKPDEQLLVTHTNKGQRVAGTLYVREKNQWVGHSVPSTENLPAPKPASLPPGLTVTLRQSANDPPHIAVASSGREKILSAPDPALEGVWIAREEPFSWRIGSGETVTGGLILPRDAKAGAPVPLVVQANLYDPQVFAPDGLTPLGFARQALAARGIAVLTIASFHTAMPGYGTTREGEVFVERVDSAVEALASKRLIDPTRVGLIGFSRSGFQAFYAVTHPGRVRLAAAQVLDAATGSFPEYLWTTLWARQGHTEDTFPKRLNGDHFWENREQWLKNDVLFNIDRMKTPTLFLNAGTSGQRLTDLNVVEQMTLASLHLSRRPFDYMFMPEAVHALTLPHLRLAAMDLTVDWMGYWLKGYEDPSAEKKGQYERWQKIRERARDVQLQVAEKN